MHLSSFFSPNFYFIYIKNPFTRSKLIPDNEHAFFTNNLDSIFIEQNYMLGQRFSLTDKFQSLSTGGNHTYFCLDNGFAVVNNVVVGDNRAITAKSLYFMS